MTIKNLTGGPTAKWSLEKLGQYCNERTDRMAVDAWLTGKAMAIAKAKTKHGGFTAWKRKWGYSDPTVSRYIRLYKEHKTPEELAGKGIMEALCEAGIHQKTGDDATKLGLDRANGGTGRGEEVIGQTTVNRAIPLGGGRYIRVRVG